MQQQQQQDAQQGALSQEWLFNADAVHSVHAPIHPETVVVMHDNLNNAQLSSGVSFVQRVQPPTTTLFAFPKRNHATQPTPRVAAGNERDQHPHKKHQEQHRTAPAEQLSTLLARK